MSIPDASASMIVFDEDRVLTRSAAEPEALLAAPRAEEWQLVRSRWEEWLHPEVVRALDPTDGLRFTLGDEAIFHVRPSGNAPQLRVYVHAADEARARYLAERAVAEPHGVLRKAESGAREHRFARAVLSNSALAQQIAESKRGPKVIGVVSGNEASRRFWQRQLEAVREDLGARAALSMVEDRPVNQAFGLLLLWQRLAPALQLGEGALFAFVFGEGTRATPFTETHNGQKPAIASFARDGDRLQSMVELALRQFISVEAHLRESGFDGLVVKWGDEVQIAAADLSTPNPRFASADVVRFVSMQAMTDDSARNKDWVGVDAEGNITAFIPRRPLAEMEPLVERGLLRRVNHEIHGGVNLGSIAVSRALLDVLVSEFRAELEDTNADRSRRPDLDPPVLHCAHHRCDRGSCGPRRSLEGRAPRERGNPQDGRARPGDLLSRSTRARDVLEHSRSPREARGAGLSRPVLGRYRAASRDLRLLHVSSGRDTDRDDRSGARGRPRDA
ncbi:MAG: hypothetical protein HC923_09150 [Myxococcales bacterium]|nr:hypothetical protein [Myxococcales bacterium]